MANKPIKISESEDMIGDPLSPRSVSAFRSFLLAWYREHGRTLPWRGTTDPYRIWVSEIILQQTQVIQGHDYYIRFIDKYPTVADLAKADDDELMLLWQGLGYYSRAHNMKVAAEQVMAKFGGVFPNTPEGVRSLKGVGPYTTAAIMSIAYNYPLAVVDGNVYRILSRLLASELPIDTTQGMRYYAETAQKLLDKEQPSTYNQAMMDLGATVCTPNNPTCLTCPVQTICRSRGTDLINYLPYKSKKTAVLEKYLDYFMITKYGKMIVERRPTTGIWKGLYQFPLIVNDNGWATDEQITNLLGSKEIESEIVKLPIHRLTHRILHIRIHILPMIEFRNQASIVDINDHPSLSFPKPLRAFLDTHFPIK